MCPRGIQPDARHGDTERAGPQHAHTVADLRIGQAVRIANNDGSERALGGQRLEQLPRRRHRDDGKIRRGRQRLDAFDGIRLQQRALEAGRLEIGHHLRTRLRAGTDHDNRIRTEQGGRTEAPDGLVAQQVHGDSTIRGPTGTISTTHCQDVARGVAW